VEVLSLSLFYFTAQVDYTRADEVDAGKWIVTLPNRDVTDVRLAEKFALVP
jgi:hypothetical protein